MLIVERTFSQDTGTFLTATIEVEFAREISFGDTDEVFLGRIHFVAVDDQGRVYLADGDQTVIHVYLPDGSYNQSLGRQGSGPGEFDRVTPATQIRFRGDQIYVTDGPHRNPLRYHVFEADNMNFLYTRSLDADNKEEINDGLKLHMPELVFPILNGGILVSYRHMFTPVYFERNTNSTLFYMHDENGMMGNNKIFEHRDQVFLTTINRTIRFYSRFFSFNRQPLLAVTREGMIFYGWSEDVNVEVHDIFGGHIRTIEYPFENLELSDQDIRDSIMRCDRGFDEGICADMVQEADQIPDTWPAMDELLVDDENRLWISTIVEDLSIYEWWVLEESGELITTFKWPRNEPIEVIKNGKMYTRETDEETGLQQVVRYKIEMF